MGFEMTGSKALAGIRLAALAAGLGAIAASPAAVAQATTVN